jgi:EAL domain-containing protein (putative c-di-GMP-specific phosphodiesterase class I)
LRDSGAPSLTILRTHTIGISGKTSGFCSTAGNGNLSTLDVRDILHPPPQVNFMSSVDLKTNRGQTANWTLIGQITESEPLRHISINSTPFVVGRSSSSNLTLAVSAVSSRHAEFRIQQGELWLYDLGSTNGTYINGERVSGRVKIAANDLIQFANTVFRVGKNLQLTSTNTVQEETGDRALALLQFDRLVNDGNLFPHFQPIVMLADMQTIGFEVLGRSRLFGLQMPSQMFQAASQLNLESELSEVFRLRGIEVGQTLGADKNLFLNTHPKELGGDQLGKSLQKLRDSFPKQAITLEIHEAAVTDLRMMHELKRVLSDLEIKLAFDDFGVGQARLVELAEIRPDFLKFDMRLTQNIHLSSDQHRQVVAVFAKMVNDLGIITLAEGIECVECHQVLLEMGFIAGQGFFYGRPQSLGNFCEKKAEII